MCIPCLDPMKNPADLNTTDLDTNKGLVMLRKSLFGAWVKNFFKFKACGLGQILIS